MQIVATDNTPAVRERCDSCDALAVDWTGDGRACSYHLLRFRLRQEDAIARALDLCEDSDPFVSRHLRDALSIVQAQIGDLADS